MPRRKTPILLILCMLPALATANAPDCRDTDAALDYWRPVRKQAASENLPANELAPQLVSCLGSPDPELRDRIGYELFTYWLRQEKLDDGTRTALLETLRDQLSRPGGETALSRSFSALVLAEVMRSDANSPFMSDDDRQMLLDTAAAALERETDFRGLDAEIGWVHPVAHMADLLWRFALHPATTREQGRQLLAAVRTKVAPTDVSYAFNEGDRLARAVSTLVRRDLVAPGEIVAWLEQFAAPQTMDKWSTAFQSPAGMAELHNTKQFLRALSDQLASLDIDDGIATTLDELVSGFTQLI
jgi:hypothetical protein